MGSRQGMALLAATIAFAASFGPGTARAGDRLEAPDARAQVASFHLTADGDLYIAEDGSVLDYRLHGHSLTREIAALVDKQIRGWHFDPILVDGKAVTARTRLTLALDAVPVAGGYALRIKGVGFGNPIRSHQYLEPPRYPQDAQYRGIEAEVVLVLTLDGQGRVAQVDIQQTSLSGAGPARVVAKWADMFEKSAVSAARKWRFELTEEVGGRVPERSRVRLPVRYQVGDENGWRALVPVDRPGHYVQVEAEVRLAAAQPASQQPQALESRFKLKDDVVGKVL